MTSHLLALMFGVAPLIIWFLFVSTQVSIFLCLAEGEWRVICTVVCGRYQRYLIGIFQSVHPPFVVDLVTCVCSIFVVV